MQAFNRAAEFLGLVGEPVNVAANVLLFLAALGCLVFVATYTIKSAWQTTPLGRHMFYFGWAVVLAYVVAVARSFWPDQNWLDYARLCSLSLVAATFWQRVYLLWRTLRESDEEEETTSGQR